MNYIVWLRYRFATTQTAMTKKISLLIMLIYADPDCSSIFYRYSASSTVSETFSFTFMLVAENLYENSIHFRTISVPACITRVYENMLNVNFVLFIAALCHCASSQGICVTRPIQL